MKKPKKPIPFNPYAKPVFYMREPQEYLSEYTVVENYEVCNGERLKDIPEGCYVTLEAVISYDSLDHICVSVCKEEKKLNTNYTKELADYNTKKKAHAIKLKAFNEQLKAYNAEQEEKARDSRYKQFLRLQEEFKNEALTKAGHKPTSK